MSTAKPMSTADREARYQKQNGHPELTSRQERQIKKTALRLEHGRHRKPVNRPSAERATKGRTRAYADWLRDFYRSQLRGMRRQNRRAKLGRYTAGRQGSPPHFGSASVATSRAHTGPVTRSRSLSSGVRCHIAATPRSEGMIVIAPSSGRRRTGAGSSGS
jgi:hypothetical protein